MSVRTCKTVERFGDTIVTTETAVRTESRTINYEDILEKSRVVDDPCESDTPWEHCDGYEHRAIYRPDPYEVHDAADIEEMRGYGWSDGNRCRVLIVPEHDDPWGEYEYRRRGGCSKQVARELVAMSRRRMIDQLKEWYSEGWCWYGVECEWDEDHAASVWGVDDYDYAYKEVRHEIAGEVAHLLEKDGYVVVNQPQTRFVKGTNMTYEGRRANYRRNIHRFDVDPDGMCYGEDGWRPARRRGKYTSFGEWYTDHA